MSTRHHSSNAWLMATEVQTPGSVDILPWQLRGFSDARSLLRELPARAILLSGPEGVGRRQLARWHAARLNCLLDEPEPCGHCASCQLWSSGHPDYREVAPAVTTSSGRQNRKPEIRIGQLVPREGNDEESLSEWLRKRPLHRRRVGVIDSAHLMTAAAANSFLKVLEEPPSWASIVLIAPDRNSLLPTIASRVTEVRLGTTDTDGLEPANHPAHLLGTPGPLARARRDMDSWNAAADAASAYVNTLSGSLDAAFAAAVELEEVWLRGGFDLPQLLRAEFRKLDPARYAASVTALEACESQLSSYVHSGIALQLLTLELRSVISS